MIGYKDFHTIKYAASDGAVLWEKRYDGPVHHTDIARRAAVDAAGNVAVTGSSESANQTDYYTAKYAAADGTLLWEARYNGPANKDDYATALALTNDGGAVVTGVSYNVNSTNPDYATIRYAPPGDAGNRAG